MISDSDIDRYDVDGVVPPLKGIEQWLDRNKEMLRSVKEMYKEAMSRKTVVCPHCYKRSQIGKIVVIDMMRYVPSYNSHEDPYYEVDTSECNCPKCGKRMLLHLYMNNRLDFTNEYPIKRFFKCVEEERIK